jgi:alkylhydroperoxidase family enzyme
VRALCELAEQLTLRPASVDAATIERVRAEGWNDAAIHDAIQVVSYFNYINRVAEGVGIEGEPDWDEARRDAPGV